MLEHYIRTGQISQAKIEELKAKWIINWIGWEWAYLRPILESIIELPYFDTEKYTKLLNDFEDTAVNLHDIDYYIWWNYLDFTIANIKLAYRTYKLLTWTNWYKRVGIFILVFIVTQKFWKKHFSW